MKRLAFLTAALPAIAVAQSTPVPQSVQVRGNPILSDGRYYSADPAPLVDGDTLYVSAGRDEAPADVNDFIMKEWQLLATSDPATGRWRHYPAVIKPERVFAWAEPARAYAGQMVKGPDGRFYFYAPMLERDSPAKDRFAIGVAVADSPTGPWTDAHPAGPIISQRTPDANDLQNIDPTVLVDDDRRVYVYWGTFGRMRGMELAADMVTPKTAPQTMEGVDGFFEAAWIMKRKGIYYMMYAANKAGPDSACTPAVYHACQAYATATGPLGPWTYRGVLLKPVSSTTSHAGAVEFKGKWYLVYHTADAKDGGHFRRSVAIDRLDWDDSVSPAAMRVVRPTRAPQPAPAPTRNIARSATAAASNEPLPTQFWIKALNDGIVRSAPLPPDVWSTALDPRPANAPWIEYRWPAPVTIDGSRIRFFAGTLMGTPDGATAPVSWRLEYWDRGWRPVRGVTADRSAVAPVSGLRFPAIRTRCLRAVIAPAMTNGQRRAVAVSEWEVLASVAKAPAPRSSVAPRCGA